jgi:hypothetical protein
MDYCSGKEIQEDSSFCLMGDVSIPWESRTLEKQELGFVSGAWLRNLGRDLERTCVSMTGKPRVLMRGTVEGR